MNLDVSAPLFPPGMIHQLAELPPQSVVYTSATAAQLAQDTAVATSIAPEDHEFAASMVRDARTASDLGALSYVGFQRTKVATEFRKAVAFAVPGSSAFQAQYWCADLLCSGAIPEIIDSLIFVASRHVCPLNPRIAEYARVRLSDLVQMVGRDAVCLEEEGDSAAVGMRIEDRFLVAKGTLSGGASKPAKKSRPSKACQLRQKHMGFRNSREVRELLAEVVYIMFVSPKTAGQDMVEISGVDEFDHRYMFGRMVAPSTEYAQPVLRGTDVGAVRIAANEFAYQIWLSRNQPQHNTLAAAYWIEWIGEFDRRCRGGRRAAAGRGDVGAVDAPSIDSSEFPTAVLLQHRGAGSTVAKKAPAINIGGFARTHLIANGKAAEHPVWILWDVLIHFTSGPGQNAPMRAMAVRALCDLYALQFQSTTDRIKKNRHLLYCAVRMFTEPVDFGKPLLSVPTKNVADAISQVHAHVYRQVAARQI